MKNIPFLKLILIQPSLPIRAWSLIILFVSILKPDQTNADVPRLISDNAAIPASYLFEVNEQTVNDIFLNTIASGVYSFDSLQQAALESIAYQCPLTGGTTVFRARAILEGLAGETFDDEVLCSEGQQGLMTPPGVIQDNPTGFKVYPNPARDELTVQMDKAIEGMTELSIYNLFGQVVEQRLLGDGTTSYSLSVERLPRGTYFLKLQRGGELLFSSRFVVAR